MTNLLLKHGADPNLKFAARKKSSARTSAISFHVSEMKESSHHLELAQLLMDYGAKDEEQMTLFTAQSAGKEKHFCVLVTREQEVFPGQKYKNDQRNFFTQKYSILSGRLRSKYLKMYIL